MSTLPPELDFTDLTSRELPEDTTLDVCRNFFLNSPILSEVRRSVKTGVVRVRFVWNEEPPRDCPDDMIIGEFRQLAKTKRAKIIIDDGEGGGRVTVPREPALT